MQYLAQWSIPGLCVARSLPGLENILVKDDHNGKSSAWRKNNFARSQRYTIMNVYVSEASAMQDLKARVEWSDTAGRF